ncbi:hypothetical protein D3C78_997590 [compost metagenome]
MQQQIVLTQVVIKVTTQRNGLGCNVVKTEASDVYVWVRVEDWTCQNPDITRPLEIDPFEVMNQLHGHRKIMEVDADDPSAFYDMASGDIDSFTYVKTGADTSVASLVFRIDEAYAF